VGPRSGPRVSRVNHGRDNNSNPGGQQPQGQPQGQYQQPQGQPAGGAPAGQGMGRYQKPRSAPAGVKALCIVMGIYGVLLILAGTVLGSLGSAASQVGTQAGVQGAGAAGGALSIFGILYAVLGIATFVVIYGLWNLRDWGWIVAVALLGLQILIGLVNMVTNGGGSQLITILIAGGLIAYLWTKKELYNAHKFLPIDNPQSQAY